MTTCCFATNRDDARTVACTPTRIDGTARVASVRPIARFCPIARANLVNFIALIALVAVVALFAVVALVAATRDAHAADGAWPAKPVRLVVGFGPGTAMDTVARLVGVKLAEALGTPVIVENRAGASGTIANEFVAKAAPDGYTLLMGASSLTMLPAAFAERAPDPTIAYTPIAKLVDQPLVVAVNPAFRAGSLPALLDLAREKPGTVPYAAGVGTPPHLAAELLMDRAGVRLLHVPYSGATMIYRDVLSGEVPVTITYPGAVLALLKSGKMKPIAVTSAHRMAVLPDVPTIGESGFPEFSVVSWYGLLGPAGLPPEIVARLNAEAHRVMAMADVRETLISTGFEPAIGTPEALAAELRDGLARWGPIVRRLNIKLE